MPAGHEPAMACGKGGQLHPAVVCEEECCHQVERDDPSPLYNTDEATCEILGPDQVSPVKERHGATVTGYGVQ